MPRKKKIETDTPAKKTHAKKTPAIKTQPSKPLPTSIKVYLITIKPGEKPYYAWTDQEFKNRAKRSGKIYTLKEFQKQFNEWNIHNSDYAIRMILE
jgi:hypothetical protein